MKMPWQYTARKEKSAEHLLVIRSKDMARIYIEN